MTWPSAALLEVAVVDFDASSKDRHLSSQSIGSGLVRNRCLEASHDRARKHFNALEIRANGDGLQNLYLTTISDVFAATLIDLIGAEARDIVRAHLAAEPSEIRPAVGLVEWEEHEIEQLHGDRRIAETTRQQIVLARRGQGLFKDHVRRIEHACRITGVDQIEHLRASHCKPWRDSTNEERLDGENGLLLTPNADHLFDRGFIGFEDNGDVIVSPVAHRISLSKLGIDPDRQRNVGRFSAGQREYLQFHREYVLLKSQYLG